MAFGMNVSSGADFRDIVKYDARAGRMFRVDRDPATGIKDQIDITDPNMRFAVDFGSIQVGYVAFTAQGPVKAMVPYGKPLPGQPQDKDADGKLMARPGFYVLVAGQAVGGVREWCSNAAILVNAMDELWHLFAAAPEAAAGKIPLVSIVSTIGMTSGTGARKSTNYKPIIEIKGWVDRLPDMGERTVPPPAAGAVAPVAAPAPVAAAPAPMPAPAAVAAQAQAAAPAEMPF